MSYSNKIVIECSSVVSIEPINKPRAVTRLLVSLVQYNLDQVLLQLLEDFPLETIIERLKEANK